MSLQLWSCSKRCCTIEDTESALNETRDLERKEYSTNRVATSVEKSVGRHLGVWCFWLMLSAVAVNFVKMDFEEFSCGK